MGDYTLADTRTRGFDPADGWGGLRPHERRRSIRLRLCRAGFGCSHNSARNCAPCAWTRTWVRTNFEIKTGGPFRCGETGWSWRRKHPELTITTRRPIVPWTSSSDGRCVCPDTKTAMLLGSTEESIGGVRSLI